MKTEKPLVDDLFLLERFPGKGGWTYARLPQVPPDKSAPFGWRTVKGTIDGHPLHHYKLMPMGNGELFLPVKAEIRKKIGKQTGDFIHVVLFTDEDPILVPEELVLCLKDEPGAYELFTQLKEGEKKEFLDWINSARKDETKVERILKMIQLVLKGEKLHPQKDKL